MKVHLQSNGELIISPVNDLEVYALKAWEKARHSKNGEAKLVFDYDTEAKVWPAIKEFSDAFIGQAERLKKFKKWEKDFLVGGEDKNEIL